MVLYDFLNYFSEKVKEKEGENAFYYKLMKKLKRAPI